MPNEKKTADALQVSMLRYSSPTAVHDAADKEKTQPMPANKSEMETRMKYRASYNACGEANGTLDTANEAPSEIEILLNEILPPHRWTDGDGQQWQQSVSPMPATRDEVVSLQQKLDTRLAQTHARATGLCAIRHRMYEECFDELIRQATINCPERGLLLLRIRDEMKMTIDACEMLYENAIAFGLRKAIKAGQQRAALTNRVNDLAEAHNTVQKALEDTTTNFDQIKIRRAELYAAEEKRLEEQLAFAKKSSAQLKLQLEAINAGAPKK